MHKHAVCWMNGTLVPAGEATVSVFDHGLLYGDGVFEGIRFYNHRAFRLEAHLERLALSSRAIALRSSVPARRPIRPVPTGRSACSTA